MTTWSAAQLTTDTVHLWALAYGFQLAAQNVLDISSHIGSALRLGAAPEDYHGAIVALGETGVLDADFARVLAPLAGLRNILVHGYLRLEAERLHEALGHLGDLRRFIADIHAFLEANPGL